MKKILNSLVYFLLAVVLAACAPLTFATVIPTLEPTRPVVIVTLGNLIVSPTATPSPVYLEGGVSKVISLDDNNHTITLHPNETFLLNLGETYEWDWQIDNQAVVSREINTAVIKGAQGIIKAHQPGVANLTATGDPLCRKQKPACGMPSILFNLQIEVLP